MNNIRDYINLIDNTQTLEEGLWADFKKGWEQRNDFGDSGRFLGSKDVIEYLEGRLTQNKDIDAIWYKSLKNNWAPKGQLTPDKNHTLSENDKQHILEIWKDLHLEMTHRGPKSDIATTKRILGLIEQLKKYAPKFFGVENSADPDLKEASTEAIRTINDLTRNK
jgi:hypothetical protein